MHKKTKVRKSDHMVFEVEPITLNPISESYYDPWCYSDPEPTVDYVEFGDWSVQRSKMRDYQ